MTAIDALQQLFLRAGAGWVLWLLGLLSLLTVAIAVERWLVLRARGGDLRRLAAAVDGCLHAGDRPGALDVLARSPTVAAAIAAAGLRLGERGPKAAEHAMQSALALERSQLERGLVVLGTVGNNAPFVGLLGMIDPARPEVVEAVRVANGAGLKTVMVTGDHKDTAEAIAREIGILTPGGLVLTGPEIEAMNDTELADCVTSTYSLALLRKSHRPATLGGVAPASAGVSAVARTKDARTTSARRIMRHLALRSSRTHP